MRGIAGRLFAFACSLALLSSCKLTGDEVGGRTVEVTLSVVDAASDAATSADVYLLRSEQWAEIDGPDRFAALERARVGGDTAKADETRQSLLRDLVTDRQNEQTPLTIKLPDVAWFFVAGVGDKLQFMPFRPSKNRTPTIRLR